MWETLSYEELPTSPLKPGVAWSKKASGDAAWMSGGNHKFRRTKARGHMSIKTCGLSFYGHPFNKEMPRLWAGPASPQRARFS
jgi:hypothetical protein